MSIQYATYSDGETRPMRVDPNYPMPSSLAPSEGVEQSPVTDGLARTTSRRRRPSGSGGGRIAIGNFPQPPAPEVPKAPPVSYRPPYALETYGRSANAYPASFAERARVLTEKDTTTDLADLIPEPVPQPPRRERRGSLNRPIGGVYSEIQQHKRDSYPPRNGPISPRRFSNPSSPQQFPATNASPSNQEHASSAPKQYADFTPPPPQASTRRASAGVVQALRKEWAPDRSPLQKLEVKLGDIGKEEKRARVEKAERRLRESQAREASRKSDLAGGPPVDRSSSRSVSADVGAPRPRRYPNQALKESVGTDVQRFEAEPSTSFPNPQTHEPNRIPQSDQYLETLQQDSYQKRRSERLPTESGQPLSQDRSQRTPARTSEISRPEQQPERGVRFQGEDDTEDLVAYSANSNKTDSRHRRRMSRTEAAKLGETRGAQRDRLRQDPPTMANQSRSKEVPLQQQELYSSKGETTHDNATAATYGGVADPLPGYAVRGQRQIPKYEIPPQSAAGIQARQKFGFGSGPEGFIEAQAHRKHHLSDILHRGHNHARDAFENSGNGSKTLDEWRQGGTARLTATDFISGNETESDQNAWWEKGASESRRKSRRASNRITKETQTLQNNAGKITSPFITRAIRSGGAPGITANDRIARTRPYVEEDSALSAKRAMGSHLGSHVSHFVHRWKHDQSQGLSSAYSYSCPNLADHAPSHENHICEPYLSKELTKSMRSIRVRAAPSLATFNPPLYLKCGPLLRYTGLKRDRLQTTSRSGPSSSERETWRGSVMIVTADEDSSYDPAPILRLFSEPMDLLPPPPQHLNAENDHDLPSEYIDPIAGLPKLSRTGKTVYVKPVDDLEQETDLSRIEDDDGLFEETRTAAVPTSYGTPDFRPGSSANPKPGRRESKTSKRGQQVRGVRLHTERSVTFWRFNIEVELGAQQARIAYSINNCPAVGFWVPARGHSMNVMFHSCNGFSMSVNPDDFSGPDPLWRDVLNSHQTRPFHVMVGGGDQIYNDAVMSQSKLFRQWLEIKNPHHKHEADFTPSLQEELETFYLERYSMWFSQGLFGMANSQIPMVNMWDDHDIIDGFGSYPHHFMSTPVFCGLGAVAFKYYMLFQHQTVSDEGPADEPSWLMGAAPGPYINELSRSIFLSLGKNVALLALDCRTERMREEILSEASYELVFERCRREIIEGETKHLVVLLGVPIAYPRLVWLENLLTSRVMDPVKALGRAGMLGGFLNKFDGGVEILDDLDDHWTAKNHKQERNWFVQELQELAAEKSVRVTILGGDVHLAAVGQFYSNPKLNIPKDKDHRYMANVVSSAIVNTPPPEMMGDILNKRNKTHHLDRDTDEDMIPMFTHDVNGNTRNNKRLLPRRNWCSIREYYPGSTPPPTPPSSEPQTPSDESPPPQNRLQRTLSLTRDDVKPGNLIRRLSGRGPSPANYYPPSNQYDSGDNSPLHSPPIDGYFPPQPDPPQSNATTNGNSTRRHSSAPLPRPGNFHRRPTNMSERAAKKGNIDETADHINLEQGLDIVLNCEVNQKDPAGVTVPYRLLIPALWYEGHGDENTEPYRKKSLISRIGSIRGKKKSKLAGGQGRGNWGQESLSASEDEAVDEGEVEEARPRRWSFGISQRKQYRDQTPPVQREHGDERPQQQRQSEDPQIGQSPSRQLSMPPRQQRQYGELGQQQRQPQTYDDEPRHDSVDYHRHLDSGPPLQQGTSPGYPGRRLSKVDRVLGSANARSRSNTTTSIPNDGATGLTLAEARKAEGGYESEEYTDEPTLPKQSVRRASQGYSGIEAYSEKKGWRRFSPF